MQRNSVISKHLLGFALLYPAYGPAKVTSVETGKSITVEINDRGPYVGNRVMDLSKAAAKKIGIKEKGVAKVKIVAHKPTKGNKYRPKQK